MNTGIISRLTDIYGIPLSAAEAEALLAIMERRHVAKDAAVVERNEHTRHMWFVEQGLVRQYYYKDGRNVTEHFGLEGDLMFCIESLFLHKRTQLGIEALEPCTVWAIDYAQLKQLACQHRGIGLLLQAIFERDLIVSQRKADSWRFDGSRQRYERFCKEYPDVVRRAPIAHIASYLLMSPETLSRVRAGVL